MRRVRCLGCEVLELREVHLIVPIPTWASASSSSAYAAFQKSMRRHAKAVRAHPRLLHSSFSTCATAFEVIRIGLVGRHADCPCCS